VGSRTSSSSACDLTLHRTNFRPNRKNASKPKKLREATVGLQRCVHSNERTRIDLDFDFKSNVSKSYTSLPKKNFNPSIGLWELRIWDLGLEVRIRAFLPSRCCARKCGWRSRSADRCARVHSMGNLRPDRKRSAG